MSQSPAPSPTSQPAAPSNNREPSEAGQIGAPFHRFQALKATDLGAATRCFGQFKAGLLQRMAWEDAHLFTAFVERTGSDGANAGATMRLEHEQIRDLLRAIERKLIQSDSATEPEERALEAALIAHNHRESRIVYSALES